MLFVEPISQKRILLRVKFLWCWVERLRLITTVNRIMKVMALSSPEVERTQVLLPIGVSLFLFPMALCLMQSLIRAFATFIIG